MQDNEQRFQDWCDHHNFNPDFDGSRQSFNDMLEFRERQQSAGFLDACEAEERE